MSTNKNIDDLFKKSLQNFEATPSPDVWNNIQSQLKEQKEDRKVIIPLWWKLGGVAAILALLLSVHIVFDPFETQNNDSIVVEEHQNDALQEDKVDTTNNINNIQNNTSIETNIANDQTLEHENNTNQESPAILKEQVNTSTQHSSNAIANEENRSNINNTTNTVVKEIVSIPSKTEEGVATSLEQKKQIGEKQQAPKSNPLFTAPSTNKEMTGVTSNTIENTSTEKNTKDNIIDSNNPNNPNPKNTGIAAIDESLTEENKRLNEQLKNPVSEALDTEKALTITEENTSNEEHKKSIFDAIEENNAVEVVEVEEKKRKNWEVTPNFGPVFYNGLGEGSSIDASFADNTQNSDTNFSYGIQVSYAISDKLSIRSGFNNVNLGYTTSGVELASGPTSAALSSVNYNGRSIVTTAVDKGSLQNLPPDGMNPFLNLNPKSTGGNAEISQNLSYYEVPLELNYALLDSRFGIDMIGGLSTLFLGNNEIVATDSNFREVLGAANNLNAVSFTTNIGVGFNYKISKRLKFAIEPMFKYQLNPYTDSSVDFNPYYLGVYSGLSFKF